MTFELGLEKKLLIENAYLRLLKTVIDISIIDTCKLVSHYHLSSYRQRKNCTLLSFAGILSRQLFCLAEKLEACEHISSDNITVVISISDISIKLFTSKKRKKWNF